MRFLKYFLYYDIKKDEIIGFYNNNTFKTSNQAKSVIIIMIRSLHDSWKQPIGYFFVVTIYIRADLLSIILSCIHKLHNISLNIRDMISDLGSNFKNYVDIEHITPETSWFYFST